MSCPSVRANSSVRLNTPHQVHLGHLMVVILQLMHANVLRDMTPVFPVSHLEMGKTVLQGQQDPERAAQIFDRPIGLHLLFELKFQ